jgi:hypothetical protein
MKILFMPGVGGDPAFWQPVADRLPATWQKALLGWPGLGNQRPAPNIHGWDDLCWSGLVGRNHVIVRRPGVIARQER